jgi:hypothetical protein
MTPLQILGFQNFPSGSPHFGLDFGVFMGARLLFDVIFYESSPLLYSENRKLTFLQGSHYWLNYFHTLEGKMLVILL